MVKIELNDGRVLTQERIVARRVKDILSFFMKVEKGEKDGSMSEFEVVEGMVKLAVSIFPKEKKLEDYLWDNYEMVELMDLCEDIITQATGGAVQDGSPSGENNA